MVPVMLTAVVWGRNTGRGANDGIEHDLEPRGAAERGAGGAVGFEVILGATH